MKELICVSCKSFEFVIFSRDLSACRKRFDKTLESRGEQKESSVIYFSQPVVKNKNSVELNLKFSFNNVVFFENQNYDLEIIFSEELASLWSEGNLPEPYVQHRLKKVQESFLYNNRSRSLRANISTGNNLGWFWFDLVYHDGHQKIIIKIQFEVFPTKMDLHSDVRQMYRKVDETYPLWRFSIAEKTKQKLNSKRIPRPPFLLLWLEQFESLQSELFKSVKFIINSPHSRLVGISKGIKLDRLHGRISKKQEEIVASALKSGEYNKRLFQSKKYLTVDTPDNRFIKWMLNVCISKLKKINDKAREEDSSIFEERLSNSFYNMLADWSKELKKYKSNSFFKEVGETKGLTKASLVLQQKTGYSTVFRIWQQLRWYLDFFEGNSSASVRSISSLYELWCFLEIKSCLETLGFKIKEKTAPVLQSKALRVSIKDGMGGAFKFVREDGVSIRLAHEPVFNTKGGRGGIKSWLTTQKPDILLEASFPDGSQIIWIFDAKYRIDTTERKEYDAVPDDAINQLHRYRDALIYLQDIDGSLPKKTRPVFGAFALYPGYFDQKEDSNPYEDAINEIGIGAFGLLPQADDSGRLWLMSFFENKFGKRSVDYYQNTNLAKSDAYFIEEAPRIVTRGFSNYHFENLTLLANQLGPNRAKEYTEIFMSGKAKFYHTMQLASDRQKIEQHVIKEVRYLGVALDTGSVGQRSLSYIYPVLNIRHLKRSDLSHEQTGVMDSMSPDKMYWLFELGVSIQLPSPLVISCNKYLEEHFKLKLVKFENLFNGFQWNTLPECYTQSIFD